MKKILLISIFSFSVVTAQNVAINNTGAVGNPNAILDVDVSTNDKGVLIPRVTTVQRTAMNPSLGVADEGLTVYDEILNSFWFWDGTQWVQLQNSSSGWLLLGNAGTNPATNFVGTTDNQPVVIRTNNTEKVRILANGNVGIGLPNPAYNLEINGTFGYGNGTAGTYRSRTETRNDAGTAATQSGFFETNAPVNYPAGATSWWHLIDVRHSNNGNNFALQISGGFFDQDLWFRKTNNNGAQAWSKLLTSSSGWMLTGNPGTNDPTAPAVYGTSPIGATENWIGTTDANDFVIGTNNLERFRVKQTTGSTGIGTANPTQKLDVVGNIIANTGIVYANNTNNAFHGGAAGLFGGAAGWNPSTLGGNGTYIESFEGGESGGYFANGDQLTMWAPGDGGYILRIFDEDVLPGGAPAVIIDGGGNMGIGIGTAVVNPGSRLQVTGGSITPQTGNTPGSGIYFVPNPGGGGGDEAYIRHYVEGGENTKLVIANLNDFDDDISFKTGLTANERVQINGLGTVYLNRGVFFDCNDCGGTNPGDYNLNDGAGGNWGDLSIQGRVLSANSNIHLSPPGGSRVVINSSYRAAGGGTGTTGLDIEDGGIRMRKNYAYIQRYRYCNCYGAGSGTYGLGNWDFCAVAHVGFKNNASTTDEDDDVQCAVYPNGAGAGEQTNYDYYYTEQFNSKRYWNMYLEAFEDTNGVTCAASCMNFE